MGTRYFLNVVCPECEATNLDVYYAPTCGFLTHECEVCQAVIDLEEYSGISYEEASNIDEIRRICQQYSE